MPHCLLVSSRPSFFPTIFGFPTSWCQWNKECSSFIHILNEITLNKWMKNGQMDVFSLAICDFGFGMNCIPKKIDFFPALIGCILPRGKQCQQVPQLHSYILCLSLSFAKLLHASVFILSQGCLPLIELIIMDEGWVYTRVQDEGNFKTLVGRKNLDSRSLR